MRKARRSVAALLASAVFLFTGLTTAPLSASAEGDSVQNLAPQATYTFTHYDPSYPDYDPTANAAWNKPDETGSQLTDGLHGETGNYDDEN